MLQWRPRAVKWVNKYFLKIKKKCFASSQDPDQPGASHLVLSHSSHLMGPNRAFLTLMMWGGEFLWLFGHKLPPRGWATLDGVTTWGTLVFLWGGPSPPNACCCSILGSSWPRASQTEETWLQTWQPSSTWGWSRNSRRGIPARFRILINNCNNLILLSLVRWHLNASTLLNCLLRALLICSGLNWW